jgi:hypothetical protein
LAPAVPLIHRIQQILASAGAPGTFATRHTAGTDDIYFDTDCRHEVRPVTSGYRAALTFNLFLGTAARRSERPASKPLEALSARGKADVATRSLVDVCQSDERRADLERAAPNLRAPTWKRTSPP